MYLALYWHLQLFHQDYLNLHSLLCLVSYPSHYFSCLSCSKETVGIPSSDDDFPRPVSHSSHSGLPRRWVKILSFSLLLLCHCTFQGILLYIKNIFTLSLLLTVDITINFASIKPSTILKVKTYHNHRNINVVDAMILSQVMPSHLSLMPLHPAWVVSTSTSSNTSRKIQKWFYLGNQHA